MLLDYNRIDPELRPIVDQLPSLEISKETVHQVRATMESMTVEPSFEIQRDKVTIATQGGEIDLHVFRKNDRPNQPAILWIHGGGYVIGNANDTRSKLLANDCDCTVFSVDYRIAPEHPFPAGPEDCYAALSWLMNNTDELSIDRSRIIIAGGSAGAGMAAGVVLMNRDRDNFPIKFQLLMYPMLDNLHDTPSGRITNHPVWSRQSSLNAWEMYLDGTPGLDASPYAAAFRATDLTGLPPAYICIGSEDLFRDENIAYARRLSDAGAPCELAVFPGMFHAAEAINPAAAVSRRMRQSVNNAVQSAFL